MDEEIAYYNVVAEAFRGDHGKLGKLKQRSGSWKNAYEILRSEHFAIGEPFLRMEYLHGQGIALFIKDGPGYPPLLREIVSAPHGIYVKGSLPNAEEAVAIVGTRRATPEGKRIAKNFGKCIAEAGFSIVSGLAVGIDAAAHEGTLEGKGTAIAVLAGGLGDIHPRANTRLARNIIEEGGALISEYPPDEHPLARRFLERNRIVSGLSKGVVVIEAPEYSGSLATARFALEQNRDVFVVPGNTAHPNFKGSHSLIRQGAELVTAPEEVLAAYGVGAEEKKALQEKTASREEMLILEALRATGGAADVDKLVSMTKLEPRIAMQALSFLFIKDRVRETGTGYTIN